MKGIKEIAKALGMSYMFDNWARVNVRADKVDKYPLLVDMLPSGGAFGLQSGQIKDEQNCLFAFLDKTPLDFDGTTNDAIIERMKTLAKKFIYQINNGGIYEAIDGDTLPYSVVYDKLDENVTGITIELTLIPIAGECLDSYGS
jgi:hypothetical protein